MKRRVLIGLWLAVAGTAAALLGESPAETAKPVVFIRPIALFNEHLYEGTFNAPMGIFFDRKANEVWVADTKNNLVGCFTPEGVPVFAFASDLLREPSRIAVDGSGRIYVLDNDRSKLKVFSYRGEPLPAPKIPGLAERPSFGALAVDPDGNLYVGENESCQVLIFGPDWKPRGRLGGCGIENGQFQAITGIAANAEYVVVTDAQAVAVQIFNRKGNFIRGFGAHDMGIQNFSLPASVALDSKGRLIAIDTLRHEIKFFDLEGNFLDRFGGLGWRLGSVAYPAGVAVDPADRLYVVEKGNARVQVFAEADGRPESGTGNGKPNINGPGGDGHESRVDRGQ